MNYLLLKRVFLIFSISLFTQINVERIAYGDEVLSVQPLNHKNVIPFELPGFLPDRSIMVFGGEDAAVTEPPFSTEDKKGDGSFTLEATVYFEEIGGKQVLFSNRKEMAGIEFGAVGDKIFGGVRLRKKTNAPITFFPIEGGKLESKKWYRLAFRGENRKNSFLSHLLINGKVVARGLCRECLQVSQSKVESHIGSDVDGKHPFNGFLHDLTVKNRALGLRSHLRAPFNLESVMDIKSGDLGGIAVDSLFPIPTFGQHYLPRRLYADGAGIWALLNPSKDKNFPVMVVRLSSRGQIEHAYPLYIEDGQAFRGQALAFQIYDDGIEVLDGTGWHRFPIRSKDPTYRLAHSGWILDHSRKSDLKKPRARARWGLTQVKRLEKSAPPAITTLWSGSGGQWLGMTSTRIVKWVPKRGDKSASLARFRTAGLISGSNSKVGWKKSKDEEVILSIHSRGASKIKIRERRSPQVIRLSKKFIPADAVAFDPRKQRWLATTTRKAPNGRTLSFVFEIKPDR